MSSEGIIDFVLSRSRTARGLVPLLVPAGLLLLPRGTAAGLDALRDQLLMDVRRRASYLHIGTILQIVGLVVAWIGVVVPHGRPVTIGGICVTLAGALLDLTGGDRLHVIGSTIEDHWGKYRHGLLEFATLRLAISPYSYAETSASGMSARQILESRRGLVGDDVIAALLPSVSASYQQDFGSAEWLSMRIGELNEIDHSARQRAIGTGRRFDVVYAALLVLILVVAVLSFTKVVPEAALATAALVVVLASRPGHLAAVPLMTAGQGEPIGAWIARRDSALQASSTSAEDLASLFTAEVAVGRGLLHRSGRPAVPAGR
ncbi:MAG TPA: hypothetical protein VLW50_00925 [Streptosporangiaceae bacterium]|nr:hypothetical protein [Streptosporangiaceae bacterium]